MSVNWFVIMKLSACFLFFIVRFSLLFYFLVFSQVVKAAEVDSLSFSKNLKLFQSLVHSNLDSSKYYLEKLDVLSQNSLKSAYRYRYYVQIGGYSRIKRDIPKTLESYKKALELAKELGNKEFIVKSQFNLGSVYGEMSDYRKAISFFKEVEAGLNDVLTDNVLFSNQFRANMVQFYIQTNDISEAFKYSNQMNANIKSYDDYTMYYMSRLQLLNAATKYKEVLKLGEEALSKLKDADVHYRYQVLVNMGSAYSELSNREKAFESFIQARELSKKLGIESSLIERVLGVLYFESGKYELAIIQFNKVLEITQRQKTPMTERSVVKNLADVYIAQGKHAKAVSYLDRYIILNDSLLGIEKVKAIKDTEAIYELQEKDKFIEQQKEVNTLQTTLLNKEYKWRIVLIGFLVCTLLFAVTLWFFYKKARNANFKLIEQKGQIETYAGELKLANQMRDKLFAMISHDLRSPVASLVNSLENKDDEDSRNRLMNALGNVQLILNNLLKWAQIQLSEKPMRAKAVHLSWILETIITEFQSKLSEKKVQVLRDYKYVDSVFADEEGLLIALRNILSNAIKFTSEGGLVRITTNLSGEGKVLISIRDSGVGMDREQVGRLFVYPESRLGTSGETGTGIGMTLTKELVTEMKGNISVQSKEGVGTSVELVLPRG